VGGGGERLRISINSGRTRRWRCCWVTSCRRRRRRVISLAQFHAEDPPLLQEGKSSVPAESVPLAEFGQGQC